MDGEHRGRSPRYLAVVASAYLVQGIVAGVGVLMLGRLAQLGTSLEAQVGLLASGAVPWLLKFILAALLDLGPNWPLRLRGLLLSVLQLGIAVCLWGLAQVWTGSGAPAEASLTALALGWITLNVCAATQDVFVDKLALDTLTGRQAWTGTLMGLGHALGFGVLASIVVGGRIVNEGMYAGLSLPPWWVALLALAPAPLLWTGEPPAATGKRAPSMAQLDLRERAVLLGFPFLCVLATFAIDATSGASFEFLFGELGWDFDSYSARLLPLAALAGILGTLAAGPAVARVGPGRAATLACVGLGLAWLGFAALAPLWPERGFMLLFASCEGLLQAAVFVAMHALALVVSARSPAPTTSFVLAMAGLNLPRVLAPLALPTLLEFGFVALFVICGLTQLGAGASLWPLRNAQPPAPPSPSSP